MANWRSAAGTRSRAARPAGRRAFSLVELAVVVAILAMLSALAMPRFADASARRRLDTAAHRVMADLRHAQQHAVATSAAVAVTFDPSDSTYVVDAPSPISAGLGYKVPLAEAPLGVRLMATSLASNRAVFNGHGVAAGDGVVTLGSGRFRTTITLTAGHAGPVRGAITE